MIIVIPGPTCSRSLLFPVLKLIPRIREKMSASGWRWESQSSGMPSEDEFPDLENQTNLSKPGP